MDCRAAATGAPSETTRRATVAVGARALWLSARSGAAPGSQSGPDCARPSRRRGAQVCLVYRPPAARQLLRSRSAPERGPDAHAQGRATLAWRLSARPPAVTPLYGGGLEWPAPPGPGSPAHIGLAARWRRPEPTAHPQGGMDGAASAGHHEPRALRSRPAPPGASWAEGTSPQDGARVLAAWSRQLGAVSPDGCRSDPHPWLSTRLKVF